MKIGIKLFIFFMCLNAATFIVNNGGFAPQPNIAATNIDMNQTISAANVTSYAGTPTISSFFDIGRGISLLLNMVQTATIGFPVLLNQIGVPLVITGPLAILFLIMIGFAFIEMWSGSTQTDVY